MLSMFYPDMNKRRSLDDTCDVFLTRHRVHSSLFGQRPPSEPSQCAPALHAENMRIPQYIGIPRPPELLDLSPSTRSTCASTTTKLLPIPGSSGIIEPKPIRLANGRCHIPRPRNPFILFRCDLVHQRKVLPRSDLDDTNISRIAGDLWREMTTTEKKPWVDLAAQEKARHALLYPDYKYAPGHTGLKTKKAKGDIASVEDRPPHQVSSPSESSRRHPERPRPYPECLPRRRSLSCPPSGAVEAHPQLEVCTPSLVSKDDIQRFPSYAATYQLKSPPSLGEFISPILPPGHDPVLSSQLFNWPGALEMAPVQLNPTNPYPLPDLSQNASYTAVDYAFLEYRPILASSTVDPGLTTEQLKEIERLTTETTFTDPFSDLAAILGDSHPPYRFTTTLSPYDYSGCSTGSASSESSPSSGSLSSN